MKAFLGWLQWLWSRRTCEHLRQRPVFGDERNYCAARCLDCGKAIG